VQARKIAAQYLAPYVYGEDRFLGGKKAMLVPRDVGLNQFGNLPRNKLKTLKGKPNIFVGTIKFKKSGKTISGIWQRPDNGLRRSGYRGTKGATRGAKTASSVAGTATGLKLLISLRILPRLPSTYRSTSVRGPMSRSTRGRIHHCPASGIRDRPSWSAPVPPSLGCAPPGGRLRSFRPLSETWVIARRVAQPATDLKRCPHPNVRTN
jgi:hypothetical protein